MTQSGKNLTLESFRGLAALAVVIHHMSGLGFGPVPRTWGYLGGHGVSWFFALSGFLIARCVLVPGRFEWRTYLASRARRIFPAYLASLLLIVAVADARWLIETGWPVNLGAHVGLLHGWVGGGVIEAINGPYWTLSHEWTFYILMAGLGLLARGRVGFWVVAIGMLGIGVGVRWLVWKDHFPLPNGTRHPLALWDQFACGLMAARLSFGGGWESVRARAFTAAAVVAGTALIGVAFWQTFEVVAGMAPERLAGPTAGALVNREIGRSRELVIWAPLLLGAGFATWCFAAWTGGVSAGRWLVRTPLPWMGRVSYSTYLWHLPVLSAVLRASTRRGAPADPWTLDQWLGTAGLLALIYGLSWVSYRCFEEPFFRRRPVGERG